MKKKSITQPEGIRHADFVVGLDPNMYTDFLFVNPSFHVGEWSKAQATDHLPLTWVVGSSFGCSLCEEVILSSTWVSGCMPLIIITGTFAGGYRTLDIDEGDGPAPSSSLRYCAHVM